MLEIPAILAFYSTAIFKYFAVAIMIEHEAYVRSEATMNVTNALSDHAKSFRNKF